VSVIPTGFGEPFRRRSKNMKSPAFRFYADDFIGGTQILNTEEIGAYILLLCHQWSTGSIPNDDVLIRRIIKTTQAFDLALVKSKFTLVDGVLKNERLEQERGKQEAFRDKQAINGRLGGRPKNPSLSQTYPKLKPSVSVSVSGSALSTPLPPEGGMESATKLKPRPRRENKEGFDLFWRAYPRRIGKGAAEQAFQRAEVDVNVMIAALESHVSSEDWTKDGGAFIPHPATWLNQRRWEDEMRQTYAKKKYSIVEAELKRLTQ